MNRFSVYAADYVSISDMMSDVLQIATLKKSTVSEIGLTKKTYERLFQGEPVNTFYEVLYQHKLRKIRINIHCKPSDSFVEIRLSELANPSDTPAREESAVKLSELFDKMVKEVQAESTNDPLQPWKVRYPNWSGHQLNTPLDISSYRLFGADPSIILFKG